MKNVSVKAIKYKGINFENSLEARWAVFFDECGIQWEYHPEIFYLKSGEAYAPTFSIKGIAGRSPEKLLVEVSRFFSKEKSETIHQFVGQDSVDNPLLIVNTIPKGDNGNDLSTEIGKIAYEDAGNDVYPFNFETINGDHFAAHPGINKKGCFELFGDDSNYLVDRDDFQTVRAYSVARNYKFSN